MADKGPLILEVHLAWWLEPYITVLCAFCAITGREPDWDKFERMVERAMSVRKARKMKVAV